MGEQQEPDLEAPGKSMFLRLLDENGVFTGDHEMTRTKFENCQDLMGEVEDRFPTEDDLARWELTQQEYEKFLLDLHDHEANRRSAMAVEVAQIERATGKKVELPALEKDQLGFQRLKDSSND
jgi:hypothetical protein